MKRLLIFLLVTLPLAAQTSTINYTSIHQTIDGFGATTAQNNPPANLSVPDQTFFFNTLGLSIYRVGIPDGSTVFPGDCSSISMSCAGVQIADMQAMVAAGGIIYATPWSPPAIYKTNSSVNCTDGGGNGALATASYANYATWLANFVQSVQTYAGVTITALSVQNEPQTCATYDSAVWTAAQLDTFIVSNLGPTFATAGLTTKIFMPESSLFTQLSTYGNTCMTDSACLAFVGGNNFHAYDARFLRPITLGPPYTGSGGAPMTNPWIGDGLKYWMSEVSSVPGSAGPNAPGCSNGQWCPTTADAMMWAALIDALMGDDNANAFLWFQFQGGVNGLNGPLKYYPNGTNAFPVLIAPRAYVFGQYARFIRPGYRRIDATRIPQSGVTVTAYNNAVGNVLVIVVTNQNSSPVTQTFTLTNTPNFGTLTPWTTSATQQMQQQTPVAISGGVVSATLPANSVTTFLGQFQTILANGILGPH